MYIVIISGPKAHSMKHLNLLLKKDPKLEILTAGHSGSGYCAYVKTSVDYSDRDDRTSDYKKLEKTIKDERAAKAKAASVAAEAKNKSKGA